MQTCTPRTGTPGKRAGLDGSLRSPRRYGGGAACSLCSKTRGNCAPARDRPGPLGAPGGPPPWPVAPRSSGLLRYAAPLKPPGCKGPRTFPARAFAGGGGPCAAANGFAAVSALGLSAFGGARRSRRHSPPQGLRAPRRLVPRLRRGRRRDCSSASGARSPGRCALSAGMFGLAPCVRALRRSRAAGPPCVRPCRRPGCAGPCCAAPPGGRHGGKPPFLTAPPPPGL